MNTNTTIDPMICNKIAAHNPHHHLLCQGGRNVRFACPGRTEPIAVVNRNCFSNHVHDAHDWKPATDHDPRDTPGSHFQCAGLDADTLFERTMDALS